MRLFSTLNSASVLVDDETTSTFDTCCNHEIARLLLYALHICQIAERVLPTFDLVHGRTPVCYATIGITAEDEPDAVAVSATATHCIYQNVLAKGDAHGIGEKAFLG